MGRASGRERVEKEVLDVTFKKKTEQRKKRTGQNQDRQRGIKRRERNIREQREEKNRRRQKEFWQVKEESKESGRTINQKITSSKVQYIERQK